MKEFNEFLKRKEKLVYANTWVPTVIETQGTFKLSSSYRKLMEMFIMQKNDFSQLSHISSAI